MRSTGKSIELFGALSALPNSTLEEFSAALSSTEGRASLQKMMQAILAWRERNSSLPLLHWTAQRSPARKASTATPKSGRHAVEPRHSDALSQVLNDRSIFPTTQHVVAAVNEGFGFDLRYSQYRKLGRRDLLRHCRRRLSEMPGTARRVKIEQFFKKWGRHQLTDDEFSELFRALATRS